jgi:fermentation-respiration switch protein FrsA (DUF1100 family)
MPSPFSFLPPQYSCPQMLCKRKVIGRGHIALTLFVIVLHTNFFVLTFQYSLIFKCKSTIEFPQGREFTTVDNRKVEVIAFENNSSTDMVVCHGSRVSLYVHKLICERLVRELGCNVVTFFFRGMNNRPGIQSEAGIIRDAEAVSKYLSERKTSKMVLGQSLGCSVALHLAALLRAEKVILENPFTTFPAILDSSLFLRLFKYLIVDEWNNFKRLSRVESPVLFLVSENDTLVPSYHSDALRSTTARHWIRYLKGANHFNGYKNKNYTEHIAEFINS